METRGDSCALTNYLFSIQGIKMPVSIVLS